MKNRSFLLNHLTVATFAISILSTICLAQKGADKPASHIGVGVKVSTLGIGIEGATPITDHSNLRGGFNFFSYDHTFDKDGVSYGGQLRLRSAEAHYDWFPFGGGFHVSPGVLLYNGNQITANALVPGGNTFTLNGTTYRSAPNDPITGAGKIDFVKAGPMVTVGFGNLLPRNHHHISFPVEAGIIYTGAPRTALSLAGTACDTTGLFCVNAGTDPTFQSNVQGERNKINNDISALKIYPIISAGFGFNF